MRAVYRRFLANNVLYPPFGGNVGTFGERSIFMLFAERSEKADSDERSFFSPFVNTTKTLYNMNIHQIRELKQELEGALQKAFSDFHNKTGVAVRGVRVNHYTRVTLDRPRETCIENVTIELENL